MSGVQDFNPCTHALPRQSPNSRNESIVRPHHYASGAARPPSMRGICPAFPIRLTMRAFCRPMPLATTDLPANEEPSGRPTPSWTYQVGKHSAIPWHRSRQCARNGRADRNVRFAYNRTPHLSRLSLSGQLRPLIVDPPTGRIRQRTAYLRLTLLMASEKQTPCAPNSVAEVADQLLALLQIRRRSVDAG